VAGVDAVFIAVGTPSRRGDGYADLSYVYEAAREIAAAVEGFTVVITKSTVSVGTGDEVERIIRELRPDHNNRCGLEPGIPAAGRRPITTAICLATWLTAIARALR
jgi:UDP-N-acetyl-D-mannosaminuronate dehydrogenase